LYDIQQRILNRNLLHSDEIEKAVSGILKGNKEGSSMLKANTDPAVARWNQLEEDEKIAFKDDCKKFVSAYSYMGQIVPFSDEELEKLYFYLKMLVRRLLLDDNTGGVDIDDSVVLTHLRTEIATQNEDLSLDQGTEEPLTPAININSSTGRMDDSELLSRLIEALNVRFGTNLTDADRVWFEQQQLHHANNPELKEVAIANDYDNFAMFFEPKIETDLIERHEANEDLFKAFFNQPDFKKMMTEALSRSLYNFFNSSEVSK
jgi:type I restriction enzyme R subunit